jgi:RNA polymerase sigma-70 factor (ECF subfamily)
MAAKAVSLGPEIAASTSGALAQAAAGDEAAFALLLRQHQRMVFSIAWNFFGDRAAAEDLAQEVFVQLFQNLAAIESESHLVFWLRQVTTRKCIDHYRWRLKRKHVSLDDWVEEGAPAEGPDVMALNRVGALVRGLPEKFRAVVVLRYQEDLEPSQIAASLGWPVNTVKSRLHRALQMLKDRLER